MTNHELRITEHARRRTSCRGARLSFVIRNSLFVIALTAGIAAAQDAPTPVDPPVKPVDRPTVDALIADLNHDDAERREQATSDLMLRGDLDDTQIAKALRSAESPEQKQRLVRVAMHRFYARLVPPGVRAEHGMGCIGIDIAKKNLVRPDQHTGLNQPALLVTRTRVGFPAHAVLRPGDLLLSFEGKRFGKDMEDEQALVTLIQQYRAGQQVSMRVLRGLKEIDVTLALDDYMRLQMITQMLTARDFPQLYEPWQRHLANLLGQPVEAKPIDLDPAPARPATKAPPAPPEARPDDGAAPAPQPGDSK